MSNLTCRTNKSRIYSKFSINSWRKAYFSPYCVHICFKPIPINLGRVKIHSFFLFIFYFLFPPKLIHWRFLVLAQQIHLHVPEEIRALIKLTRACGPIKTK